MERVTMASLQEQLAALQAQTTTEPTQTDDLRALIAQVAKVDVESVHSHATLGDDLGIDSITLIELAVQCEQAFKVPTNAEAYLALRTVGDLEELLAS